MKLSPSFEIIEVADEYFAIPVGERSLKNKVIFSLSKSASFLLNKMKETTNRQKLVDILTAEYKLDRAKAAEDVDRFISLLLEYGIIIR